MSEWVSYDQALELLAENRLWQSRETVPIGQAAGRRLAEPVTAKVQRPAENLSAMDGYAVRLGDVLESGAALNVVGEAPAGRPFEREVNQGEAVRIFTGGVVPKGADHIVIQEEVTRDNDVITTQRPYGEPEYVRPAGMDFAFGQQLLAEGDSLGPAALGLAAAANVAEVTVWIRPRIGILANGDELKPPGSELQRGDVVNSNPLALAAAIESWGGEAIDLGVARDSLEDIRARIEAADDIDLFLPVGGASVGDHDHMRAAFGGLGFKPLFEKVAVRPGKPTWFSGKCPTFVLGLPGNPASAFVCAHLFLKPMLTGRPNPKWPVQLDVPLEANGPRTHFMRAHIQRHPDGTLSAKPTQNQDSSLIRPLVECNGLLHRAPEADEIAAGGTGFAILTGERP